MGEESHGTLLMSRSGCEAAAAVKGIKDDYGAGLKARRKGDFLIGGCFGGDSGKGRDNHNRRTRQKVHQSKTSSLPLPSLFTGW